ncbi:MAG: decaprenyl-phosphate phosphoribosyltransferase [Gemmatimonadetes bacterium]|nr:decaprenyl-phosphate phosphoribosyltransferase [Gemmatimonadota bacterium]MBL0178264.1 decaprenyl-phosphate phosphoribosyltransferase [Gemmatimonadota bacterium]
MAIADRSDFSTPQGGMAPWYRLLRPSHWTKNLFVLAPLLFSGRAREVDVAISAGLAFVAFCLAASSVYAFNDVLDRDADRRHPTKRLRPVAAGQITTRQAMGVSGLLAVLALLLAQQAHWQTAGWVGLYLGLNLLYSFGLKRVVLLDVFAIASFFVLRLLAGAAAVAVAPSVWLLLCGGLLALYLGFAKRRHELSALGDASATHRSVLAQYSAPFLDQISSVLLAVTIVSYLMYSLTSDTARRVGTEELSYGIPFVLYGVFRYLYLVHQRDQGTPTETVLSDRWLLATVALWLVYNGWVLYRP